jgi:sugar phosphate isomerase/epimerase
MSRVFASTACLRGSEPLTDRVERYLSAGIGAIELGAGVTVDRPPKELKSRPASFLVHNYFPPPTEPFVLNLSSPNDSIRGRSLALSFDAMHLCEQLDAPFYSVHGGFITDPNEFVSDTFAFPAPSSPNARRAAMKRYIESIRELLDRTSHLSVRLLVENNVCYSIHVGKLLFSSASDFEMLFTEVNDPRLGILLDTGHLNVSSRTLGFSRSDFVRALGPRIGALHLHDNDGLADQHRHPDSDSWTFGVLDSLSTHRPVTILEAKFSDLNELASAYERVTSLTA